MLAGDNPPTKCSIAHEFSLGSIRVKDSAKSPTRVPDDVLAALKRSAVEHFRNGGNAPDFAKAHEIPRTTVLGWKKVWKERSTIPTMGRPRKLPPFNESKALGILLSAPSFHDWESVQRHVRAQSGEELSRRAVLRYMARWGISGDVVRLECALSLIACPWVQPAHTIHRGDLSQSATIWRLISGRGLEGFMFARPGMDANSELVADALIKKLGVRRRRLGTNSPDLHAILERRLPEWRIGLVADPT